MYVTDLIAQDHKTVQQLFERLEAPTLPRGEARTHVLEKLIEELEVHAQAEEAIFYPAVRSISRRIPDAEAAHAHLRALIAEVQGLDASAEDFVPQVRQLKQSVLNHAAEEEGGALLDAARLGLDELERLGQEMESTKRALKASLREGQQKVA